MKPIRTWILVANGTHARMLLNEGQGKGLSQIKSSDIGIPKPESLEPSVDRPGRVYESFGTTRHAVEVSDAPHTKSKRMFAHQLAENLERNIDQFDRLIMIAAPVVLGALRDAITPAVETKVHAAIAKDLTKTPTDKITEHLADTIAI